VLAGGQGDAGLGDVDVGGPVLGVGDLQRAGLIAAVDLDVEGAACALRRDAGRERVGGGGGDGDGVLEPLAGLGEGDGAAAGDVGDVGAGAEAVGAAAEVCGLDVVVGDVFAAVVEVLGLEGGAGGEGDRGAG
jgi:hypothetical protein